MWHIIFPSLVVSLTALGLSMGANCPSGWTFLGSKCYVILQEHVSWYEAVTECSVVNGQLVEINSEDENSHVVTLLTSNHEHYAWIGLQDLMIEGQFVWNGNGTIPVYTNYHHGQPDDNGSGADCIYVRDNGEWYDDHCHSSTHATVCQKNANYIGDGDIIG